MIPELDGGSQETEDRGWSTGERQDAVFKALAGRGSLPQLSHAQLLADWALGGFCQMPLKGVGSIQKKVGTDREGALELGSPELSLSHSEVPLILVT